MKSLLAFLFRRRVESDLEEELRSHLANRADDLERGGLSRAEAERQARIEFGGFQRYKEECREALGARWLGEIAGDIRYALRQFRRNPAFAAIIVLTLALGIGANTAIFSLTYAVILNSLPVTNPGQLVRYTFHGPGMPDLSLSGPLYDALRKHETVNRGILAWWGRSLAVRQNGTVTRVHGALMTSNGFRVLELRPYLGRVFDSSGDGYQAVLGYSYWKTHFHGNPAVLGRSLSIHGRAVTIVGVLPHGFKGLISGQQADIVLPLSFEKVIHAIPRRHDPGSFWLTIMGRLKPGESVESAQANLKATVAAVRQEADPTRRFLEGYFAQFRLGVESGRSGRSFLKVRYSRPLLVLELLVALLLLLCCGNTALLMLARVSGRAREFAVRSALGAGRRRLLRQLLVEVGLLAGCGLAAGIWLGWGAARALVSMIASIGEPPPIDIKPQIAILSFAAGITVLSTLVAGLWPALRASRADPMADLKQGGAHCSSRRLGSWIVPVQVAVSLLLVVSAFLLGGTFLHLWLENSGFHTAGVTMAEFDLSTVGAKPTGKQAARDVHKFVKGLENAPGIKAATVLSTTPISGGWMAGHYFSVGKNGTVHTDMRSWPESVSPEYFRVMGTRILEGRGFKAADENARHVCVLSASAAQYFFPSEDAIGKFVYLSGSDPKADGKNLDPKKACRVVGIAENARFQSLREAPPRMVYSLAGDWWRTGVLLAVRSSSTSVAAGAIRNVVHRVTPAVPRPKTFTFDELVKKSLRRERMLTSLSGCFAGIALLLTAIGLYGLLSRIVTLRTKEIGLRLALGAQPRNALALVIRQALRLVLIGAGIGLLAAFGISRLLRTLLFGIQPDDPWLLSAATAALIVVALVASYLPARRASKIDPMAALREE